MAPNGSACISCFLSPTWFLDPQLCFPDLSSPTTKPHCYSVSLPEYRGASLPVLSLVFTKKINALNTNTDNVINIASYARYIACVMQPVLKVNICRLFQQVTLSLFSIGSKNISLQFNKMKYVIQKAHYTHVFKGIFCRD